MEFSNSLHWQDKSKSILYGVARLLYSVARLLYGVVLSDSESLCCESLQVTATEIQFGDSLHWQDKPKSIVYGVTRLLYSVMQLLYGVTLTDSVLVLSEFTGYCTVSHSYCMVSCYLTVCPCVVGVYRLLPRNGVQ